MRGKIDPIAALGVAALAAAISTWAGWWVFALTVLVLGTAMWRDYVKLR